MSGWANHSPVFLDTMEIADPACSTAVRVWISPSEVARSPDKWDWRVFGELVGERSNRFLEGGSALAGTKANQAFLGPSALGICHNYTISFGAQLDISDELVFPSPEGAILDPDNLFHRYFQPVLTKAGLRKMRLHDLRQHADFLIMPTLAA
jgi:hypothetical protein